MNESTNLSKIIKSLEELILASTGADPFEEILKLIYIKLYAEKYNQELLNPQLLFKAAKIEWKGAFSNTDKLLLAPQIAQLCLGQLGKIKLYKTDLQIIDTAFEYLLPKKAKGNRGQYFTPRHVIDVMIKILNPKKGEIIVDPACGSGGFLLHSANYLDSDANLYGVDFDRQMQRTAKILLLLSGYEKVSIINVDSLTELKSSGLKNNFYDIVMTNPPFGGEIKDISILQNYELAKGNNGKKRNKAARHILFMERIINLLKPGGRAGIVVPQGILNNTNLEYVRAWIYKRARIVGVIGLDANAFKPFTNVKTSLLFLQKWKGKPRDDYPIFMAVSQKSGKNLSGNLIYKNSGGVKEIDSDLFEIAGTFRKFIKKEGLGF